MAFSALGEITAPYSVLEAWSYDFFIAPAMQAFYGLVDREIPDKLPDGNSLLDVGCGGGHLLVHLANRAPQAILTGLDLAPGQVKRANRRLAEFGARARVRQGSALDLPFDDDSFDYVMSVGSVKHWPDMEKGLRECARVLKPGGRLAVAEADRGCRMEDVDRLFEGTRLPRLARPRFRAFFRTYVAGLSLDLVEARDLAQGLPLRRITVERTPNGPGWLMDGVK